MIYGKKIVASCAYVWECSTKATFSSDATCKLKSMCESRSYTHICVWNGSNAFLGRPPRATRARRPGMEGIADSRCPLAARWHARVEALAGEHSGARMCERRRMRTHRSNMRENGFDAASESAIPARAPLDLRGRGEFPVLAHATAPGQCSRGCYSGWRGVRCRGGA